MKRAAWFRVPLLLVAAACGGPRPTAKPIEPPPTDAAAPTVDAAETAGPAAEAEPTLRLSGDVRPQRYRVALTLDPDQDSFGGVIDIAAEVARPTATIWMHGKELTISAATVGDQPATASLHGEFLRLDLPAPIAAGTTTIHLEYRGQAPLGNGVQEGLFRQRDGSHTYLYSQFEATGARRAFPCFDEPSFKVPWQVTVDVPAGMVALSNTAPTAERDDAGQHHVEFAATRPLPSYLIAVAVGPFDLVDGGRAGQRKIPVRIAVPKGRAGEARYAATITRELIAGLETYLGMPFPYDKLDQVAIPTFLGAMENPGLITYASRILLAKPSEESAEWKRGYASTGAHELAHHWFGDLVTMAWWDDIWLNESFADFLADRVVDDWQPTWGTRMQRLQSAQGAFATDSLMSARKIHNPIREHNDIVGVFDAISYAKGGSLLAMFEAWVGRDAFRATLTAYLTDHQWGNASSQDFIDALARGTKPEVSAAFASFLDQGGIPLVRLDLTCDGDRATLALAQERFLPIGSTGSTDQRWSIPMCVAAPGAAPQCFLFDGAKASVPLDAPGCPAYVDGNPGGRGYYRVRYAGELGKKLVASTAIDSVSRAAALFNLRAMVDGGYLPMSDELAVLPDVARDPAPELLAVALDLAGAIQPYVDDAQFANYLRFTGASFGPAARKVGWKPKRGEDATWAALRPRLLAAAAMQGQDPKLSAEARKLAAAYLRNPASMEPELATIALATATRSGDAALAGKLEAAFGKTDDHTVRGALLAGMVASRDPAVRGKAIARLGTGELTMEELITVVFSSGVEPTSRDEMFGFVTEHLDTVLAVLPFLVRPAIVRIGTFYCDAAHRAIVDEKYRPKIIDLPGGEKELTEVMEAIDLCIARKDAVGADVRGFLARQ